MSNPCSNELRFYFETKENEEALQKFFSEEYNNCVDVEENSVYFDSRWTFPEDLMNELYYKLPNKDDIDMTCLSVEWGCLYCEFHVCDGDGWTTSE